MAKKQKQSHQDAQAPQDENPHGGKEKRKKNTTPVQKKERPKPEEH
jgi:hypothetical protein